MSIFSAIALLVVLTALFSYLNYRYLRLPRTIGLMAMSLVASLSIAVMEAAGLNTMTTAARAIAAIDFSETVLTVVLSFLLFAGALHIDLNAFLKQKWAIGVLSTLGVVISTGVIGLSLFYMFPLLGLAVPLSVCLLFGALISPTDPIAVLALLKETSVPKGIEMKVAGESLLNDGVGVVLFLILLGIVQGVGEVSFPHISMLLVREAGGGIALGIGAGYVAYQFIKRVDDYCVEILLSIALVVGGYALARELHVSGPLAMVAAGLFIGNRGRLFGMSDETRKNLDLFWEVVDDVLNASLFVLVGFEALLLSVKPIYAAAAALAIPLVLFARFVSVWLSSYVAGLVSRFSKHSVLILTWGGLRGGISLALALALPQGDARDVLLFMTYAIVVFSILVQGLTMRPLIRSIGV